MERVHKGSADPFHPSFWYITPSMGFPEGTQAGGKGVPFEDAELVIIKHFYGKAKDKFPSRKLAGASMIALGTGMLIPGPIDAFAFGAGVAVFKHPIGGIAGVAAYNLLALGVIGAGAIISTS